MITVENITKSYGGETVLNEASFVLNKGERCGVVGRNGSGKTTLFRLITKQETSDGGIIRHPKGYHIGCLEQHIRFTQPNILAEAALGLIPEEKDHLYKVEAILFGLGFKKEDMIRSPDEFSGGYQLRLHLAKVLVSEPDCLLLDEPTNYLDIVSIRWFQRFLRSWKGELLLISHDREFIDSVTTHTLGIHRHEILKLPGTTEKWYAQILAREEMHEKTLQRVKKKREHAESFIERFGAKATKAAQARSRQKTIDRLPALAELSRIHNLDFSFRHAPFPGHLMVDIKDACFSYKQPLEPWLIEDLSLAIEKRSRIAVIGKNGRGKTTILHLLTQALNPKQGAIKHSDNTKIGFFGQTNIDRLQPKLTIEEEIGLANPSLNRSEVRRICGIMMFGQDKAEKAISVLSGGEKSRVLLGKIIASPCNLLVLDEPTNHLDMESIEALLTAIEEFPGAVVIVTHSERILKQVPDTLLICHEGKQHLFQGGYEEFLQKEGWREAERAKPAKTKKKNVEANTRKNEAKALKRAQRQISQIENAIIQLEEEVASESEALALASQSKDSAKITELSVELAKKTKRIEELYQQLLVLSS